MKITKEAVQKVAHLARLEFSESETQELTESISAILDWMEVLNKVDTTGVEPLIHISQALNVMREDIAMPPLPHDKGMLNAPKRDSNYFRVPKVIE